MHYLLTILLSFYPSMLIYSAIPAPWMRWVDGLAPAGMGFFLTHLAVFALILFLVHIVINKFISLGYGSRAHRSLVGIILLIVFVAAIAVIIFYNVLPGNMVYESPSLLDNFLLKSPFSFLALVLPMAYLYFD